VRCESIIPPGKAEVRHHSSRQTTTHQCEACRPPISSQTPILSGGKIKMVSLMRSIAPALTLVSGPRRGTLRPTTSTTQRISRRAHKVSFSIAVPRNLTYPPQHPLTSSPRYLITHGEHHLIYLQSQTAAALSSTQLRSLEGDAAFGWLGLVARTLSLRWIPNISIVLLWCE